MSNKGIDRRAEIDAQTVKALLLIHGGGAVALLTFLPTVLGEPAYEPLLGGTLWALCSLFVGLIITVLHNHYRRRCSLEFERHGGNPPACDRLPLSLFKFRDDPPCICRLSVILRGASILALMVAGGFFICGVIEFA